MPLLLYASPFPPPHPSLVYCAHLLLCMVRALQLALRVTACLVPPFPRSFLSLPCGGYMGSPCARTCLSGLCRPLFFGFFVFLSAPHHHHVATLAIFLYLFLPSLPPPPCPVSCTEPLNLIEGGVQQEGEGDRGEGDGTRQQEREVLVQGEGQARVQAPRHKQGAHGWTHSTHEGDHGL